VFVSGGGHHEIDFQSFPIRSNSIHFLTPGQVHLISRERNYHGYLLVFSKEYYGLSGDTNNLLINLPFFNNYTTQPVLDLPSHEFEQLMEILMLIKRDFESSDDLKDEIIRHLLSAFLLKCRLFFNKYNFDAATLSNPSFALMNKFKTELEANFQRSHSVTDYASNLSVSPVQLNKIVKSQTGENASDVIINRIVLEAKRLLIYTSLSSKEIAYRMQYDDPSYFSRIFKRKVGISPSVFRAQMHKKYQK
jgi:AraC-like DNA-binding protein